MCSELFVEQPFRHLVVVSAAIEIRLQQAEDQIEQCGTGGGKNDNEYYTNERIEIMIMVIQNRNSEIRGKVQKGNGI